MELKEARELAEVIRQQSMLAKGLRVYTAIVTLDDRIIELEAENKNNIKRLKKTYNEVASILREHKELAEAQRGEPPFREILDWFMCSDPWPDSNQSQKVIVDWLNKLSVVSGYENWVVAYHEYGK